MIGLEAGKPAPGETPPVAWSVVMKLFAAPALVWLLVGFSGADPLFRATATLLAACPTAVNVFIQTRTFDVFARGGAMAVVAGTVLGAVTLPLVGALLSG